MILGKFIVIAHFFSIASALQCYNGTTAVGARSTFVPSLNIASGSPTEYDTCIAIEICATSLVLAELNPPQLSMCAKNSTVKSFFYSGANAAIPKTNLTACETLKKQSQELSNYTIIACCTTDLCNTESLVTVSEIVQNAKSNANMFINSFTFTLLAFMIVQF